jgi:opacity protein-like surface antigen
MLKKIILISITGIASIAANADSGAYVNADVGFANIQYWWSAGTALTINAGYNFNPYFATEVGGTWITPITSQYTPLGGGNGTYTQSQSFGDIAAKGSLPLSDIFNAYAKIGVGLSYATSSIGMSNGLTSYDWNGSNSSTSLGLYMALGGELKLSQHWGLTIEDYGLIPFGAAGWGNINVFGVGGKYNF